MNVLLIVLDTARRDAFEPYGAPRGTPAVTQLAARGTVIDQAYATASWTLPSHASIFTGMLPRQLGLTQAPQSTPQSARPVFTQVSERMLGQVLRSAGFTTQGWSTNVWASPAAGLDVGFDSFEYVNSGRDERMNALLGGGRRAQLAWALDGLRSTVDDGATEVGARLRSSIEQWSGQPAFWFVNLCECHSPYLPPRPWNDLGARERIRAALEVSEHLTFASICLYLAGRHEVPAAAMERMHHLYRRAIAYMDSWLAGILEALDARGILDETLVVLTSDHGENFGEHRLLAHGFSVNQQLTHVPLVIAGPGAGAVDRVFSLAELPKLIADAAGIAGHPYAEPQYPPGVAIAQFDPLAPGGDPRYAEFAGTYGVDEAGLERLTAQYTSVTDGATKLVIRDGAELVYDLRADPGEDSPLDPAGLDARLGELRGALHAPGVLESTAAPAPALSDADAPSADEVAAIERQMKLLGYM
jgi:arylsulfatase A-like enzyme